MLPIPRARLVFLVHVDGGEFFEVGDWDEGYQSVELVLAVLIFVAAAGQTDSDSVWDILDSLAPDELVHTGVNTDIGGSHLLGGKVTDGLDGAGSSSLKSNSVDVFVQVNGVFTSHQLVQSVLRLTVGLLAAAREEHHGLRRCRSPSLPGPRRRWNLHPPAQQLGRHTEPDMVPP